MLGPLPGIDSVGLGFCLLFQNVDNHRPDFSHFISNSTLCTSVRFKVMLEYLRSEDSVASILPLFQEGNRKDRESIEELAEERRWYPSPGCSELF